MRRRRSWGDEFQFKHGLAIEIEGNIIAFDERPERQDIIMTEGEMQEKGFTVKIAA